MLTGDVSTKSEWSAILLPTEDVSYIRGLMVIQLVENCIALVGEIMIRSGSWHGSWAVMTCTFVAWPDMIIAIIIKSKELWVGCDQYFWGFYLRPVLAFGYCRCLRVCVCLSVNHQLVRAVTLQPFKLESPNLDQRCKRPWLRSLLFFGMIDLELQGQIKLKVKIYPILSLFVR